MSKYHNVFLVLLATTAASATGEVTLLQDDFGGFRAGSFGTVLGAHAEYHYLAETSPKGNWVVSTFRSEEPSQRAWRVVKDAGGSAMAQTYANKYSFYHTMLISGDPAWRDYTATVAFTPEVAEKQCGVVFRYRNDRCYYFVGIDGQRAVLKLVKDATDFHTPFEKLLDEQPCTWTPGARLEAVVTVSGDRIDATLCGVALHAVDDVFAEGKIGITADGSALFHSIAVTASAEEANRIAAAIAARDAEEAGLQAANPKLRLWKRIELKDFGVGRNVRFGDMDGDGACDVLLAQVLHHGPKDRNSEPSCLTAVTFDGKRLWQIGEADPWKDNLTNDVAFQIHDLDGDGRNEVVYCKDMTMIVADAATGETRYSAPTPKTPPNTMAPYDKFPRILGDSLYFCDLRGTGRDADIVLKDRYLSVWAFNDKLELLWHRQCNTGHYPYAYDVDGDGKDELMVGHTLFDDDGRVLWSNDHEMKDHADGVAIVPFREGEAPRLLCAASDEGIYFANMQGRILKHHFLGHVQNPVIADFRPDLPGLEALSINFWGNQGIVHFYDADGEVYHDFEPVQHGSMCLPINWTGQPGEFWVLSANVEEGGLYDGWGRRVVLFPADGHPDLCNAVVDLTGDAREEIVVWDSGEMWVYTQDNGPLPHLDFTATKNPLYNDSNYKASISIPMER